MAGSAGFITISVVCNISYICETIYTYVIVSRSVRRNKLHKKTLNNSGPTIEACATIYLIKIEKEIIIFVVQNLSRK